MTKTNPLTKEIEHLIDQEVRPVGFIKKGKKWVRTSSETVCCLMLGKNRWKPYQHFLDINVSINILNPRSTQEPVWHIIGSMFSPDVDLKSEWEKCLNIHYDIVSNMYRQARLVEILKQYIVPVLKDFETLDGIKRILFSGQARGMGIRTELQNMTGYRA